MSNTARLRHKLRRKKYKAFPPWITKSIGTTARTLDSKTMCSYFKYFHRRDPLFTRAQFKAESRVGPVTPKLAKFNLSGESGPFKFLRPAVTQLECQWMVDAFKLPELKDHVIESINVTHDEINITTSQYKRLKL